MINQLATECAPETLGAATLAEALAIGLRISKAEAQRRISEADDLGPRVALSGELLEPLLPTVAAAQLAVGGVGTVAAIVADHVRSVTLGATAALSR